MPPQPTPYRDSSATPGLGSPRRDRAEAASRLLEFDEALRGGSSQRAAAEKAGVPRSTLRHWSARRRALELPEPVAAFLETPAGLAWLHQLVVAAVFVMTLRGPEGIRLVCEFLEVSGLAEVVAASFGAVQKWTLQMQREVAAFGEEQRVTLGQTMPPKAVTVCEDETFHPNTCLVAIEPVSGFILVEGYVERRDAQTWNTVMDLALRSLPVEVVQCTSDQGKALLRHARDIEAHHSPDLFHPQHDLSKATALSLAHRVRQAAEKHEQAVKQTARFIAQHQEYRSKRHDPGRPPDFIGRIERARQAEVVTRRRIEQAVADQKECREAIAGLSTDYHSYRLSDGVAQSAEEVQRLLEARFVVIDTIADRAGLSKKCRKKIEKARRVMADMVATIGFVHTEVAIRLVGLSLSPSLRTEVATKLVPGLYLQRVAARAQLADERHAVLTTAEELLAPLRAPDHPLQRLSPKTTEQIEAVARTCADLFQRSSSCVEGRNGRLALFHHGLHRLTDDKLAALTVVHNFHTRRHDGTTAADRFFETEHDDLFSRLVERMPQLSRPARPRSTTLYMESRRRAA